MRKGHNILITGGFGFIGLALARRILSNNQDDHITLLGRQRQDPEVQKLRTEFGSRVVFDNRDVCDMQEDWYPEVDQVYHLAARKTTTHSEPSSNAMDENLDIDMALMGSFATRSDVKVLYTSTGEIVGPLFEKLKREPGAAWPVAENMVLGSVALNNPSWMYALSKMAGEMRLRFGGLGFKSTIVRLQNPYGPRMGDGTLIPTIMRAVVRKEEVSIFLNDTRPLLYIDDVCDGLILAMNSSHTDGVTVNLCGPETLIEDVVKEVFAQCGTCIVEGLMHNEFDTGHVRALRTTTMSELGWRPKVALDEGIRRTWAYYHPRFLGL